MRALPGSQKNEAQSRLFKQNNKKKVVYSNKIVHFSSIVICNMSTFMCAFVKFNVVFDFFGDRHFVT